MFVPNEKFIISPPCVLPFETATREKIDTIPSEALASSIKNLVLEESKEEKLLVVDISKLNSDDLLLYATKVALLSMSDSDFPISCGNIYKKIVTCVDCAVDVKLTKFKKVTTLMEYVANLGWIQLKDLRGSSHIVFLQRDHPDLQIQLPVLKNKESVAEQLDIEETEPILDVSCQEYDDIAKRLLLLSFKASISDDILPISASTLFSDYMLMYKGHAVEVSVHALLILYLV